MEIGQVEAGRPQPEVADERPVVAERPIAAERPVPTEGPVADTSASDGQPIAVNPSSLAAAVAIDPSSFDRFIRDYRDSTVAALRTVGRSRDGVALALVALLVVIAVAGLTGILTGAGLSASLLVIVGLLTIGLIVTHR